MTKEQVISILERMWLPKGVIDDRARKIRMLAYSDSEIDELGRSLEAQQKRHLAKLVGLLRDLHEATLGSQITRVEVAEVKRRMKEFGLLVPVQVIRRQFMDLYGERRYV